MRTLAMIFAKLYNIAGPREPERMSTTCMSSLSPSLAVGDVLAAMVTAAFVLVAMCVLAAAAP